MILPVYNRDWRFERALDSVVCQSFLHFECIVVDDGSKPAYAAHIEQAVNRLDDGRFKLIRHRDNRGVAAARNTAVKASSGDWVAFLDSDDVWHREKLTVHHRFLSEREDKSNSNEWDNVHLMETQEVWIRNEKRVNPHNHHKKMSGDQFDRSLQQCCLTASSLVVSRRLFVLCGMFDEKLPTCEDYSLWLRLLALSPLHLIDKPLVTRYQGHEQLSSQPYVKDIYRIKGLFFLLSFLNRFFSNLDIFSPLMGSGNFEKKILDDGQSNEKRNHAFQTVEKTKKKDFSISHYRNDIWVREAKEKIMQQIEVRSEIVCKGAWRRKKMIRFFFYKMMSLRWFRSFYYKTTINRFAKTSFQ